jgi:RNA polymerase sigma factor (sigma-70 family)
MPGSPPPALVRLLGASDASAREAAWSDFLAVHSRLLLHVCRSLGADHDAAMDRYLAVLDQLQADDFRRLRTFAADGRSEFSTWLVVVAQRICLDHLRHRYGRPRVTGHDTPGREEEWAARRRLVDLLGANVDVSTLTNIECSDAEDTVRLSDLYHALDSALSTLPPRDRLLVKLRFEDDVPMSQIARDLKFPTRFHAYRRLAVVLDLLRLALERGGVREAAP